MEPFKRYRKNEAEGKESTSEIPHEYETHPDASSELDGFHAQAQTYKQERPVGITQQMDQGIKNDCKSRK